jgi:hypothetical protein
MYSYDIGNTTAKTASEWCGGSVISSYNFEGVVRIFLLMNGGHLVYEIMCENCCLLIFHSYVV